MFEFLAKYWLPLLFNMILAYLIGGINSSIVATKFLGIKEDIRNLGSGNAGFTNALRTMGKKVAILAFVGDFTKGVLAVFFGIKIASMDYITDSSLLTIKIFAYVAALMCILGHVYPCFFGFRGGKGILTAWASSLLIDWRVFLILISVFLIVFACTKVVSIASICAAMSFPIASFIVSYLTASTAEVIVSVAFSSVMGLIVIIKHKSNIVRILNGTEKKISVNKVN